MKVSRLHGGLRTSSTFSDMKTFSTHGDMQTLNPLGYVKTSTVHGDVKTSRTKTSDKARRQRIRRVWGFVVKPQRKLTLKLRHKKLCSIHHHLGYFRTKHNHKW